MSKKHLAFIGLALVVAAAFFVSSPKTDSRKEYEAFLKQHPYYTSPASTQLDAMEKEDRPDLAWQQDFLLTMNPELKRPTPEVLYSRFAANTKNLNNKNVPGDLNSPWIELGPNNVGGRVRALMFDPNDAAAKKVWAGGVTGGLWYNNDITNVDSMWHNVDDFWDNIAVTAIAVDPTDSKVFYVGTGEGWRQSVSGAVGAGIWKTEDGGKTWALLQSTTDFHYIHDLIVRDESGEGVLYVGIDYSYPRFTTQTNPNIAGLYRSTDGGSTFTRMNYGNNNAFRVSDLEIGADNRLWVGTYFNDGLILYSDDGTTYNESIRYSGEGRVELGCAPSNANYIYAVFEKSSACERIAISKDNGKTWNDVAEPADADGGIPDDDFTRKQAWYDLIITVDPNDENTAIVGGVDLFITQDGGSNWDQLSHWYGGFGFEYVHADQHAIVYRPTKNNSSEVIFGNDGGIFYCENVKSSGPTFDHVVNNFNTVQFYACAIHPTLGEPYFLAGAQDNGTQRFKEYKLTSTDRPTGGDGAFCHIDQVDPEYQITAYVYNRYYISRNSGTYFSELHWDNTTNGWFINPTDYDDHQKVLYGSYSESQVLKLTDVTTGANEDFIDHDFGSKATNLKVSPFNTSSTTLYVGTASGRIFKVLNANTTSYSVSEITGSAFPNGAISCIEFGQTENQIIATFYNYGVNSIWYSSNGGKSWQLKEGDMPDMPIRWALINPTDTGNVILATQVGVWSTSNFGSTFPNWNASVNGMANVRVDMFKMRESDLTILAATHGRGLFASQGFTYSPPSLTSNPKDTMVCAGKSTEFKVTAIGGNPLIYNWYHNEKLIEGVTTRKLSLSNVSAADTGSYYCIVTNKDGADTSETARLSLFSFPKPNLGPDLTIRPEVTLKLTPGPGYRTYLWLPSATGEFLTVKGEEIGVGTHQYIVTVYTEELCSDKDTISITVDENSGINSMSSAIKVFPNPAKDFVTIESISGFEKAIIYDLKGKLILESVSTKVDIQGLNKGQYLLKVITEKGLFNETLIVK